MNPFNYADEKKKVFTDSSWKLHTEIQQGCWAG